MAPGGSLLLSGIINEQEQAMRRCLAEHGLSVQARHEDGEWVAFVAQKG
ncbi:MAG: 50S ribosomal protein L11 methyltransferase [Anaerolineae bacterium]